MYRTEFRESVVLFDIGSSRAVESSSVSAGAADLGWNDAELHADDFHCTFSDSLDAGECEPPPISIHFEAT